MTGASYRIRELRDRDEAWPDLVELFRALYEHHRDLQTRDLRPDWEERWHEYLGPSDERLLLLAERDGVAVAYVNACIRESSAGLFTDERYGWIDDAFVTSSERKQGLGKALLRRVEEWCRERDVSELRLNVVAANEIGLRFWEAIGFRPTALTLSKPIGRAG